jgi:hypothetical protein
VLLLPWCQRRYRDPAFSVVHGVNVQLVTDPVLMPAKGEHGCDSGSESLDKHVPQAWGTFYELVCVMVWAGICHDGRTQLKMFKEH